MQRNSPDSVRARVSRTESERISSGCTAKDGDAPASASANTTIETQRVGVRLTAHSAGSIAGLPDLAGFGAPIRNRRSDNDSPPPKNITRAPSQISSTSGL